MKIVDKENEIVYIQGKDVKLLISVRNMVPKQFPFNLNWTNIGDDEQFIAFDDAKLIKFLVKKDWIPSYSSDNVLVRQRLIKCFRELIILINNSVNQYDNHFTELEETACKKIISHKLDSLIEMFAINNKKIKSPVPEELAQLVLREEKTIEPYNDTKEEGFIKKVKRIFKTNKS